ncbi:MAG: hypothetical protein LBH13_10635 [Cellulomonadaceae bacterium]|jgi:hypothetical protein|nr:hypothetical protein [Cellulomonadaceae bacterium]
MNIEEIIATEAEYSEQHRHDPLPEGVSPSRTGAGATVLSVRLTKNQYSELRDRAIHEGLPTSTFAKTLILSGLGDKTEPGVVEAVEQAIRHILKPELLAAPA